MTHIEYCIPRLILLIIIMIASIAITFILFTSIQARVINTTTTTTTTNTSCKFNINYQKGDMKRPQPLILSRDKNNEMIFLYPVDKRENIEIDSGVKITLSCPGDKNFFLGIPEIPDINNNDINRIKELDITCIKDKLFMLNNSMKFNLTDIGCKESPNHTARRTSYKCFNNNTHVEVGFQLEQNFLRTFEVCRNDETMVTHYAKVRLDHNNGAVQSFPRLRYWISGNFFNGYNMNNLYHSSQQKELFKKLFGDEKLSQEYVDRFGLLTKGHLVAKSDLILGHSQRSTFWYINAAPQWQGFNNGNWNALEGNIRAFGRRKLLNLDVYTGVHGQMNITDVNNNQIPLFLFSNSTQQSLPVPRFFWKVIYDPLTKTGTAFVGLNDPYALNITDDMYMCQDISSSIKWLKWSANSIQKGVSYACAIDDLRKNVPSIPQLKVHGVLK